MPAGHDDVSSMGSSASCHPPFSLSHACGRPFAPFGTLPRGFGKLPAASLRLRCFVPGESGMPPHEPKGGHKEGERAAFEGLPGAGKGKSGPLPIHVMSFALWALGGSLRPLCNSEHTQR